MMVEELRELSARLIHAQDEERRRIARQLHETTAQDLVALKMNCAQLTRTDWASDAGRALLAESIAVVERSLCEIRTLSYLLYPPLLDEAGLASALRWYVSGFTQRSGIRVELDVPDDLQRLAAETEGTLFRIVQESLINIHRHAGSATAAVRICTTSESLMLEVQDDGRGMPPVVLKRLANSHGALGVGIAGMRERVSQLDGELQIESSDRGTTIRAIVPLARSTPS
jgi:signal transduction histidine kinase